MKIDWMVAATIAAPIVALFLGALLDRMIELRPRVIAYYTHASAFTLPGPPPFQVNTHGIVLKNIGGKAAIDVRVRHFIMPVNFNVHPVIEHEVRVLPGGGTEMVFPTLVPGEQVSISYLTAVRISRDPGGGSRHFLGYWTRSSGGRDQVPGSCCPDYARANTPCEAVRTVGGPSNG